MKLSLPRGRGRAVGPKGVRLLAAPVPVFSVPVLTVLALTTAVTPAAVYQSLVRAGQGGMFGFSMACPRLPHYEGKPLRRYPEDRPVPLRAVRPTTGDTKRVPRLYPGRPFWCNRLPGRLAAASSYDPCFNSFGHGVSLGLGQLAICYRLVQLGFQGGRTFRLARGPDFFQCRGDLGFVNAQ